MPTTQYAQTAQEAADCGIDRRLYRGATEHMTATDSSVESDLDDGEYRVYSASGSVYTVRPASKDCNCPDKAHNLGDDELCKHGFHAILAAEMMPVPAAIPRDKVNPQLDCGVGVTPQATDDAGRAVADGGRERPADCSCIAPSERDDSRELPCFQCYNVGFRAVNPEAER